MLTLPNALRVTTRLDHFYAAIVLTCPLHNNIALPAFSDCLLVPFAASVADWRACTNLPFLLLLQIVERVVVFIVITALKRDDIWLAPIRIRIASVIRAPDLRYIIPHPRLFLSTSVVP